MAACSFCGKHVQVKGRVMRKDVCPACGRDLHACVQCRFHDTAYHNQCREPNAPLVKDREKANLCDYFEFKGASDADRGYDREKDKARKSLDDLFKKKA